MPYIKPEKRVRLDELIDLFPFRVLEPGDLNYIITKLVLRWMEQPSYTKIATITGVLKNVSQEFYRRAVAPYEDQKAIENGDVY